MIKFIVMHDKEKCRLKLEAENVVAFFCNLRND